MQQRAGSLEAVAACLVGDDEQQQRSSARPAAHDTAAGGRCAIVQPNYGLLATASAVHRGACQRLVAELLQRLGVHILSGRPLRVSAVAVPASTARRLSAARTHARRCVHGMQAAAHGRMHALSNPGAHCRIGQPPLVLHATGVQHVCRHCATGTAAAVSRLACGDSMPVPPPGVLPEPRPPPHQQGGPRRVYL